MIRKTLDIELPNCPRCGAKAIAFEQGGYGFFNTIIGCSDEACELHEIDRTGGKVKNSPSRGVMGVVASWKERVKRYAENGRSPLVVIKPNNMVLTLDLNCPRCREHIVITRLGIDCYQRDFNYPCPHCDEKIEIRLPKESK